MKNISRDIRVSPYKTGMGKVITLPYQEVPAKLVIDDIRHRLDVIKKSWSKFAVGERSFLDGTLF